MASLLLRLRGLSPLGPIFGKELRVTARLKRTYVLRSLYLAALLVVLLFFYVIAREQYGRAGGIGAAGGQKLSELGAIFFAVFSFFTLGAMALVGPILTATAVNSERLRKTLPVLLMTPITAWQIVSGKLFSRLLIAFTLIGLSLPALSVVRLLGGVETQQIVACLVLCVSTVVFVAAVALFLSTLMNRAYAVILLSYGLMGLLYALMPLLIVLFLQLGSARGPGRERIVFNFLSLTNPAFQMAVLCFPGAPSIWFGWQGCALAHLGAAAALLLLSAILLRRSARRADEGGAAPTAVALPKPENGEATVDAAPGSPQPAAAPGSRGRKAAVARSVADNPILWREIRRPLTNRSWQAVTLSVGSILILVLIYCLMGAENSLTDKDAQIGFAVVFCGLLTLLTCVISATAIAQEKESDTWTLLLATPLSARRIVLAKAAGLMRRLLWPGILIIVHFFLFALGGVINWMAFWIILWLTFSTNLLWLASGLHLSLRLRAVTFAVIGNLLLPVLLYLGVLVGLGILGGMAGDNDLMEVVGVYSPYGLIPPAVEYLSRSAYQDYNYYASAPNAVAREVWVPYAHRVSLAGYVQIVVVVGVSYLIVSGLILAWTVYRFDDIVGRARQKRGWARTAAPAP